MPRKADFSIADYKHDFLALLLEVAAGLPDCHATTPRGACSAWQRTVSCRAPRSRALERPGLPTWSTLDKLEVQTGIELWRWLIALRRTTLEEMAEALGQEAPAEPLTATRRRWLGVIDADGLTDAGVKAMADVLRSDAAAGCA
jgi:hypothetical protein